MKPKIYTFLFVTLTQLLLSQSLPLEHLNFQEELDSTCWIYQDLKVKDTSALIITISRTGLWSYGMQGDHFIFYPNGKVKHLEKFVSTNKKMRKNYSKRRSIKKDCKDSLIALIATSHFSFDQDSLSAMPEPLETDSGILYINTWDGLFYSLIIWRGNRVSAFDTRSPESIILAKATGYREKQKLLALIQSLDAIIDCSQD